MRKFLFSITFLVCAALCGTPIQVQLKTESSKLPLYLAKINEATHSSYINQLESILHFDLQHNGSTQVVNISAEKEKLSNASDLGTAKNLSQWEQLDICYVVKPEIQNGKLFIKVLDVYQQSLRTIQPITLTNQLSLDRKKIHLVADAIHETFLGKPGIASTHILYTVKKKNGTEKTIAEVWQADYDGANATKLTQENTLCVTPTYLAPKPGFKTSHYAYVSYKTGQPKMMIASLKENTGKRLSTLRGNQLMPAFSKKRDQLAFVSDAAGNADLFLYAFDPEVGVLGKPRQIFARPYATEGSPVFSPDGTKIAFVSNKDGLPRIYVMLVPREGETLKTIIPKLLTKRHSECTAPSWAPDGNKIAYCSKVNGVRQIYVMDLLTGRESQLTSGSEHKENPSWAPNSLMLVYNTVEKDSAELYLIDLHLKRPIKISEGPGMKRFPSWEN